MPTEIRKKTIGKRNLSAVLMGCLFLFASHAAADGNDGARIHPPAAANVPSERIDPKLSPVIPGQAVTAGGKSHKVISTSGPVPVSPAPEAPTIPQAGGTQLYGTQLPPVSVIVDHKHGDSKHSGKKPGHPHPHGRSSAP